MANDLVHALGPGWTVVAISGEGQLWGSVAPRWLFLSPPTWQHGHPRLVETLSAAQWASHRSLVAMRRLDGSIRLLASLVPNDLRSLPGVESAIVDQSLQRADLRFSGPPSRHDLGGPLGQLLVLLDVISREMCAATLARSQPPQWDPNDLRRLGLSMSAETNELIEALEVQARDGGREEPVLSLAQRLSDHSLGDEDRLIYLTLRCQRTLALSKLSTDDAHLLMIAHPD
jgi:hypothetical protein